MSTIKVSDIQPALKEALCLFELLRRVGHDSANIFIMLLDGPSKTADVYIRVHQGKLSCALHAGLAKGDAAAITKQWIEVADFWNKNANKSKELEDMWNNSKALRDSVRILAYLESRGLGVIRTPIDPLDIN
jgi:hypothetical protein